VTLKRSQRLALLIIAGGERLKKLFGPPRVPTSMSLYRGGDAFGVPNVSSTGSTAAKAKITPMLSNVLARIFVFIEFFSFCFEVREIGELRRAIG
jgi:hypothetical protein